MSDAETVVELLERFREAVEDGDYEDARDTRTEIRQAYAELRRRQRALVTRAQLTRDAGDVPFAERKRVNEVIGDALKASVQRASFAATADWFLQDPESADADRLTERIEETTGNEQQLAATTGEVRDAVEKTTLPGQVTPTAIRAPTDAVEVGDTFDVEVVVENVGDAEAAAVVVRLPEVDGLEYETARRNVGALPAGESTTLAFETEATSKGVHTATVRVDWSAGRDTTESMIQVGTDDVTLAAVGSDGGFDVDNPVPGVPDGVLYGGAGLTMLGGAYAVYRYVNSGSNLDGDDPSGGPMPAEGKGGSKRTGDSGNVPDSGGPPDGGMSKGGTPPAPGTGDRSAGHDQQRPQHRSGSEPRQRAPGESPSTRTEPRPSNAGHQDETGGGARPHQPDCPNCGAVLPQGADRCQNCGAVLRPGRDGSAREPSGNDGSRGTPPSEKHDEPGSTAPPPTDGSRRRPRDSAESDASTERESHRTAEPHDRGDQARTERRTDDRQRDRPADDRRSRQVRRDERDRHPNRGTDQRVDPPRCPECETAVQPGDEFCTSCGVELGYRGG
ncbi:MAG: CARDB domain-containing protein [Halobacteriales archaeon]